MTDVQFFECCGEYGRRPCYCERDLADLIAEMERVPVVLLPAQRPKTPRPASLCGRGRAGTSIKEKVMQVLNYLARLAATAVIGVCQRAWDWLLPPDDETTGDPLFRMFDGPGSKAVLDRVYDTLAADVKTKLTEDEQIDQALAVAARGLAEDAELIPNAADHEVIRRNFMPSMTYADRLKQDRDFDETLSYGNDWAELNERLSIADQEARGDG